MVTIEIYEMTKEFRLITIVLVRKKFENNQSMRTNTRVV